MILVQQQRNRFVVSSVIRRIHCTALRELYRIQLQSICSDCTVTVVIYGHFYCLAAHALQVLSMSVCVCVLATFMLNISELSDLGVRVQ